MEQVLLKDICKITMGQSPKSEFYRYTPEGIPFMQGCTTFGKFYPTIDTWTVQWNKEAQFNDILFTVRAPVGNINYAPCRMAIGRGLAAIHPIKIEREYLYYLLKYEKGKFLSKSNGSVYDAINIDALSKMKLNIHDKESRQKIATLLNNYDDLIENNNKRIKLLEQMAAELYKEWFVRFRFPGYESVQTKIQNAKGWTFGDNENGQNIPEPWSFGELKALAEFIRGKNITLTEMIEGSIPVISAGLEPSGYHNVSNVEGYNLTISASGANAGYLSYHLEDIWAADCSYYNNKKNLWFVYHALNFLQPVIKNMQIGSAQPHVYAKNINRISTIIPSQELIDLFMEKVKPLYEEIKVLKQKNEFLTKQRDSLLPRLMSGKIDLEDKEVI